MTQPQIPPNWYKDPYDSSQQRWWDGYQWTQETQLTSPQEIPKDPADTVMTAPTRTGSKRGRKAVAYIVGSAALLGIGGAIGSSDSPEPLPAPTVTLTSTSTVTVTETVTITPEPATDAPVEQLIASEPTQAAPVPQYSYYANCTEAWNAGAAPLREGDPGYRSALDRDKDGVACETRPR